MKASPQGSGFIGRVLKARFVRRLIATSVAAVLAFSPMAPWPVTTPAHAGLVKDCFDAFADGYDTASAAIALAENGDFMECAGEMASSTGTDLFLDASVVLMTALGIAGDFNSINSCKAALANAIAVPILEALKLLVGPGSLLGGFLAKILGQSVVNQLVGFADNALQQDFVDFLNEFLGPLMHDLNCGCELVGGAMQIGKTLEQEAKDTAACFGDLAKVAEAIGKGVVEAAKWLGKEIGELGGDIEQGAEDAYCDTIGAIFGGCSSNAPPPPPENIGTTTGGALAVACTEGFQFGYKTGPNTYKPFCGCTPGSTLVSRTGGGKMNCKCDDPTQGYGNDSDVMSSGCSACAGTINEDGSCHTCDPGPVGTVAIVDHEKNVCHYTAICDAPLVYDSSSQSCTLCPANFVSNEQLVVDQTSTVEHGPGRCVECPSGTAAPVGSINCQPLNCSLVQEPDAWSGHSCVACDSVGHRLDADVCLDSSGKPLYPPTECSWGSSFPLGNGISSTAAYNSADCKPLDCKGTDHPDDDGHECMKCQNVLTLPKEIFGGAKPVAKMSVGAGTMVSLSNGRVLLFTGGQQRGGTKEVQLTDSDGKTQTVNAGGSSGGGGDTVQVCLDPDNNPAHRPHFQTSNFIVPGVEILRQQPDLQFQDYKPPSAYLIPGSTGTDPGNFPDTPNLGTSLNGAATGADLPMTVPGQKRPPRPPRSPGGTATTVPAQGNQGGSSTSVPAEGNGAAAPSRSKGDGKGGFTTETVPAEGDGKNSGARTGVGPARSSKGKTKGGYTTETVPAEGGGPRSAGPSRSSKRHDNSGYTTETMPAEGSGPPPKTGPQLRATPQLNEGPQLRTKPELNGGQQLQLAPRSAPAQGGQAAPSLGSQQDRTKPTLNDSSSGPTLTPNGGRNLSTNPFGR